MNTKKILIAALIIIAVIVIFVYLGGQNSFEEDGLLSGSVRNSDLNTETSADLIRSEAVFVQQIAQLENVSFDNTSVFEDERLQLLVDNTAILDDFPAGRSNPFIPINSSNRIEFQQTDVGSTQSDQTSTEADVNN